MRMVMRQRLSCLAFFLLFFSANVTRAQVIGDLVDSFTPLTAETSSVAGKRTLVSSEGDVSSVSFTGVVTEVGSSSSDFLAEFRFRFEGIWSKWAPAYVVASATGGTYVAGYRQESRVQADRFEFRVSASTETVVVIRNAGTFDNSRDEDLLPAPVTLPIIGRKFGAIIPPRLITRAEWNAQPFRGTPANLASPSYDLMTWHHAAGYSAETREEGEAQMRAMQDLHQNIRGWSDIGYQFAIDRGGRLYQGRPFMDSSTSLSQVPILTRGAHVGGHNTGNIGVVIMGCYHPPEGSFCEQEITPAAFDTYITLFSFLSERYGVAPTMIRGHRDFSSTACPGDNNYVLIPQLISNVNALLLTGNEPLGEGTITASVGDDGVVDLEWGITEDFGIESLEVERITSQGTSTIILDALSIFSFIDASLAGESEVIYLLIASGSDGRRQELARIELQIANPSNYLLTSTFPNPASSSINFRYFLSADGIVSSTLYDALGRIVYETDLGFQEAQQWYLDRVDVSGLTAGVYYFRVQVSSFGGLAFDKSHPVLIVR